MVDAQDARGFLNAPVHLLARRALALQRVGDVGAHVLVRVEGEQLEHEGDVALRRPLERDVAAAEQDHARDDQDRRQPLRGSAAQPARPPGLDLGHLRNAPNVMPRRSCFRSRTVNTRIGTRNSVVPAATAGQSWPPSPMMIGMNGGAVCALPEVSRTANAYSFQAKMRQKIAVATIPVVACGSTTLRKACRRV